MEELRRARARTVLDLLPVEHMPTWAAEALAAGLDSPSLREVAGMDDQDPRDVHDAFTKALDELGAPAVTEAQARREMARAWAQAAIEGTMTPYEAARHIWWEAANPLNLPGDLIDFVALASEWEDAPAHRATYETDILDAARRLLANS